MVGAVYARRRYALQVTAVGRVHGPDLRPPASGEEVAFEDEPRPVRRPLRLVVLGLLESNWVRDLMQAVPVGADLPDRDVGQEIVGYRPLAELERDPLPVRRPGRVASEGAAVVARAREDAVGIRAVEADDVDLVGRRRDVLVDELAAVRRPVLVRVELVRGRERDLVLAGSVRTDR